MESDDIRASLTRHGLSQGAAARLLGVRDTTLQRWCDGSQAITETAARMLLLFDAMPDALEILRRIAAGRRDGGSP